MLSDPIRVALRMAEIFESLGIPYLVGGAVASVIFGEPRATEDIDVLADIAPGQTDALIATCEAEFYVPLETLRDAVHRRTSFNIVHLDTVRKVDVFVVRDAAFDREEMNRRRSTIVARDPEQSIYVGGSDSCQARLVSARRRHLGSPVA